MPVNCRSPEEEVVAALRSYVIGREAAAKEAGVALITLDRYRKKHGVLASDPRVTAMLIEAAMERIAGTITAQGAFLGRALETVGTASFRDAVEGLKAATVAYGISLDKYLLLSGGATSRSEVRHTKGEDEELTDEELEELTRLLAQAEAETERLTIEGSATEVER